MRLWDRPRQPVPRTVGLRGCARGPLAVRPGAGSRRASARRASLRFKRLAPSAAPSASALWRDAAERARASGRAMVYFLHRVLWKQVLVLPDALDDAQDRCVVQVSVAAVRVPRASARPSCGAPRAAVRRPSPRGPRVGRDGSLGFVNSPPSRSRGRRVPPPRAPCPGRR